LENADGGNERLIKQDSGLFAVVPEVNQAEPQSSN
jgi:hypothetical protein